MKITGALSPDQRLYATTNSNRIRLFDTKTSQLKFTLVDNNHENGVSGDTILAHVQNYGGGEEHYLISSVRNSHVFCIWDLRRGIMVHRVDLAAADTEGSMMVLDVCNTTCSLDKVVTVNVLVVDGSDSVSNKQKIMIYQYNPRNGKLVRKIKTGADMVADASSSECGSSSARFSISACGSRFAVISNSSSSNAVIRIIDAVSGKRLEKIKFKKGTAAAAGFLNFAQNSAEYLTIGGGPSGADAVYIVRCNTSRGTDEVTDTEQVKATLAVDSLPVHAHMILRDGHTNGSSSSNTSVEACVVVTNKSGSISLFEPSLSNNDLQKSADIIPAVNVSSISNGQSDPASNDKVDALTAVFSSEAPQQKLLIARNSSSAPSFDMLIYRGGGRNGTIKESVIIESSVSSALVTANMNGGSKKRTAAVLGPGEVGIADTKVQDIDQKKKKIKVVDDETAELIEESSETLDEGPSIAERISALSRSDSVSEEEQSLTQGKGGKKNPSTKSMVIIISQALSSSDNKQLEIAFKCHDKNVVENTIAQLKGSEVVDLLGELVHRIASKPSRTEHLIVWIRMILTKHSSLLMNDPSLASKLAPLQNLLSDRVESLSNFLKLQGRLLMLANRK